MPADTISIISAAVVTIVTAVVGYLKGKVALEFKRINGELESAREARAESQRDRESIREELVKCHELHQESDRRANAADQRATAVEIKAARLEAKLSFLEQQIQTRPS